MTSLDPQNPLYGPPVENLCVRVWVLNRKFVESVCEVNEYHISQIFLHPLDFGVCQRYFWHLMLCLCRIFWLLRILIKKVQNPCIWVFGDLQSKYNLVLVNRKFRLQKSITTEKLFSDIGLWSGISNSRKYACHILKSKELVTECLSPHD